MEKYGYIYKFTFLPKNLIYVGKRKATNECPEGFVNGMLKKGV